MESDMSERLGDREMTVTNGASPSPPKYLTREDTMAMLADWNHEHPVQDRIKSPATEHSDRRLLPVLSVENLTAQASDKPKTSVKFKFSSNSAFKPIITSQVKELPSHMPLTSPKNIRIQDGCGAIGSYSRPQLDLLPLMHQWNMAAAAAVAAQQAASFFRSANGPPFFPYEFRPSLSETPTTLSSSMAYPSQRVENTLPFVSLNQTTSLAGEGIPTRRPLNPFKPPPLKKYRCDECGKAFSRSNTLITHKRIHTGEKPFTCEACGRAFRQPGNLTRHKLTHTTVKPYICPTCSKAFNRASNLHTHMRTHSNFRPFICYVCGKPFQQKADLKVHFYSHTGQIPQAPTGPNIL